MCYLVHGACMHPSSDGVTEKLRKHNPTHAQSLLLRS